MTTTFAGLTSCGVATRQAAELTGLNHSTVDRRRSADMKPQPVTAPSRPEPASKLSIAERAHVLAVLNSDEFVDPPPLQVYSRYIVGVHVHNTELGLLAKELM